MDSSTGIQNEGMSMSNVDCCCFCLKTKVAINLQHCRSKNKKQSGSQNEGVEC